MTLGVRSAPVYTNLGVVYMRTGKFERAVQALTKATELAPGMPGIDLNLSLAYYQQREFQQALALFRSRSFRGAASLLISLHGVRGQSNN